MLRKIYKELVLIRKELQTIASSLEPAKYEVTIHSNIADGHANNLIEEYIKEG